MRRTLPDDWYPGTIPDNVVCEKTSYIGSSYNFSRYHSEREVGVRLGHSTALCNTILDMGPRGTISIGDHSLVTDAYIICDSEIEIGSYVLISWFVVLMDTYRGARKETSSAQQRIRLGDKSWIGFEACILPGVTVGEGSIVGARAVVCEDVPPYSIVAGNPAKVIRSVR